MNLQLDLLDRDWIEAKMPSFQAWLSTRVEPFSSDDLHVFLGEPPEPNWVGVMMSKAKKLGMIEKVGWKTSERKQANGRTIRVWAKKL